MGGQGVAPHAWRQSAHGSRWWEVRPAGRLIRRMFLLEDVARRVDRSQSWHGREVSHARHHEGGSRSYLRSAPGD